MAKDDKISSEGRGPYSNLPPKEYRTITEERRANMAKGKKKAWRKKNRVVFDKDKLMFRINRQADKKKPAEWDYSVHLEKLALVDAGKLFKKRVLYRTAERLNDDNVKTYADFIQFRYDCIIPDADGEFGSEQSIEFSIQRAKDLIKDVMGQLAKLGFIAPDWTEKLTIRQRGPKPKRTSKRKQALIDDLEQLSFLKRSDT